MQQLRLPSPSTIVPAADRAVALGLFDGVHLGHRRVISSAIGAKGLRAAVFTFSKEAAALKPQAAALCSRERKAHIFNVLGVDDWFEADFNAFRDLSPEAFVRDVLCEQLGAKRVCCGFNFRFGKNGSGDVSTLQTLCDACGIELVLTPELTDGGKTVSSDRIRRLIEQGEVQEASRLLGHAFLIDTPVSHGQRLGRVLGSPTANQILPSDFVRPRFGVYTSTAVIDGVSYYGVTNIGVRPTVGADAPLAETWFEDFDGDLYDRPLQVVLTGFLRDEMTFSDIHALKDRILTDRRIFAENRKKTAIKAVLFDFDDTLQERPVAFRHYAEYFVDNYLPHTDSTEREDKIAQLTTMNNSGYVDYPTYFTEMPKALGVIDPPPSAVLFKEYQRLFPTFVHLFEDAVDTIQALRDSGYRIGIVTNGPLVQQHRKLDVAALRSLVDTVLVSSEEEVAKPDAELFRRAAARLGLSPKQCLFVGDHPVNDIDGALQSGMSAVFIDSRFPSCGRPHVPTIHRPSDLLSLIDTLI